jgi:threonine dehydrogenase-like Zn-dependent dehydrogenase
MNAVTFSSIGKVDVTMVPLPQLEANSRDALVRVRSAGLCGSDLHPYLGKEVVDIGTIFGHEMVGIVESVSDSIDSYLVGKRVLCPFSTCCGEEDCVQCRCGLSARCPKGQLLGFRSNQKGLHGCQAEFVRVPLARGTLVPIPDDVTDEEGLLIGDIFSTAVFCATNAGLASYTHSSSPLSTAAQVLSGNSVHLRQAPVVVVVGCGPVGLCAIAASIELLTTQKEKEQEEQRKQGVNVETTSMSSSIRVFALDSVSGRLAAAQRLGAIPLSSDVFLEQILKETNGVGADVVLECVGAPSALESAFNMIRPGGVISSVGVHTSSTWPFTLGQAYDKNITFRTGRCPARSMVPYSLEIIKRIKERGINLVNEIISHRVPLSNAPDAYKRFSNREDGYRKIVFIIT